MKQLTRNSQLVTGNLCFAKPVFTSVFEKNARKHFHISL